MEHMEIFCGTGLKRPVRLSDATRRFAVESMHGKYGDLTNKTDAVDVDVYGYEELSETERYAFCIDAAARKAPLRFIEGEKIIGSATLGMAMRHVVPARRNGGHETFSAVSHVTLGFDRILKLGLSGVESELARYADRPYNRDLHRILYAFRIWHARYLAASQEKNPVCHELLLRVPFLPPRSFHEAVQSLWFTFAFTRLCGNRSDIGRIDEMLGPYLKHDLESGILTLDEAREILAHFFIKGCEWTQSDASVETGDAQHHPNIVLAGVDRNGSDVTNEVTYLVLDIAEELAISDFPITIRLSSKSDEKLIRRAAEVIRYGGGIAAIGNEDLILSSLADLGYPEEEARGFAIGGCREVQIPGNTCFMHSPFDACSLLMKDVLGLPDHVRHFDSYEELWEAYAANLKELIDAKFVNEVLIPRNRTGDVSNWKWKQCGPACEVVSLLESDCLKNGRSYYRGGPRYTVYSPRIVGAAEAGNSLHAIDRLCFRDRIVSFDELMHALSVNWEGYGELRQRAMNTITCFGCDDAEADSYVVRLLDAFADFVNVHTFECPVKFIPGVSDFGRQIGRMPVLTPSPMGTRQDATPSGNADPLPAADVEAAEAVIQSYCKANLRKLSGGAELDIRLLPSAVSGENGIPALSALIKTFLTLGGFSLRIDVTEDAALSDRNARSERQDMISERTSGGTFR